MQSILSETSGSLGCVAAVGMSMVLGISALPVAQAAEWPMEDLTPGDLSRADQSDISSRLGHDLAEVGLPGLPGRFDRIGLSFDLAPVQSVPSSGSSIAQNAKDSKGKPPELPLELPKEWWHQGSDSPIAIAIGLAEGTRTLDGGKTAAYYWHSDPGNGADNYGTFSYQHLPPSASGASAATKRQVSTEKGLPEQADRLQLKRLEQFYRQLQQQASAKGLQLTELELLNGLDLANQSEAAALSPWGYVDRLVQMRALLPDQPDAQIQEARTWAYWSPDRHTWDAPGLGNTYASIQRDQSRRFAAVKQAWQAFQTDALGSPRSGKNSGDFSGASKSSQSHRPYPAQDFIAQDDRAMAILFFQESG